MPDTRDREALLALPIHHVPFVLLDVESTGLDARAGDRICEIAFVRWQGGEVIGRFETLVDPGRSISAGAYAVNGIEDDALMGLFDHLLTRLRRLGVVPLADLVRAQRGLLPGQPEPEAPPLIAEALRN